MAVRAPTRKQFDAAFPTFIRYLGAAVLVFYAVGNAFGLPIPESVLIAATGLILYKTVAHGGNGNGGDKPNGPP